MKHAESRREVDGGSLIPRPSRRSPPALRAAHIARSSALKSKRESSSGSDVLPAVTAGLKVARVGEVFDGCSDHLASTDVAPETIPDSSCGGLAITAAQIANTTVPTLAIAGSGDPYLADLREMKKFRPSIQLMVIEGASHDGERGAIRFVEVTRICLELME